MRVLKPRLAGVLLGGLCVVTLPWWASDQYQLHLATLIGVYWILVAGLNLVVGYSGQLSIGHVGLLCIGSYAFAIVTGKWGWHSAWGLSVSTALGALCGFALGLPSLRLPGFYFAMATMAFTMIVNELVLAQVDLTGGGVGLAGPMFPPPFDSPAGFYALVVALAAGVTWLTWNIARRMWGRALISIRDNPVAAQAVGVPVFKAKLTAFVFSGASAGLAGAVFASLQSYITPDTFVFELSMFFFVCIIIGGRGSIWGPFFGTVVLTALPEMVAPLARLGNFFYGLLLLMVVLLVPEGIGRMLTLLGERLRPRQVHRSPISPNLKRLAQALESPTGLPLKNQLQALQISKEFGGLRALDQVTLGVQPGEVHGLIGPNGSGKTTLLNMLSGYYQPTAGRIVLGGEDLSGQSVQRRAQLGVARTFQKPRLMPMLTVLENAVLGAWTHARSGFMSTAIARPAVAAEERALLQHAEELLQGVGLGHVMHRPASLLDHAEQRFLEIARALALRPRFVLLDEPAGGLTEPEIEHLGGVIRTLRDSGIGVLLVEHHTDFVFRTCDRITTLHVGRMICHGSAQQVRNDPEVIRVYLGA